MKLLCFFGWHRWEYFAVRTKIATAQIARICLHCQDMQSWMGLTFRWSMSLDKNDSVAKDIVARAENRDLPSYEPVDLRPTY